MENTQKGSLLTIIISTVVILAITAIVFTSSGKSPVMPVDSNLSVAPATVDNASGTPAVAVKQPASAKSYVPTPTSATVSQISTLQGRATATMHCNAPSTGRCQTGTGYAQFGVKVYQNGVLIQATKLATDGTFKMKLAPGTYIIYPDWYIPGMMVTDTWTTNLPKTVTTRSGVTTLVDFSINYIQY